MAVEAKAPRAAEAGHWGEDVRSDLLVAISPRASGGVEIGLESRVEPYYGKAIRAQILDVMGTLGVENALLTVRDGGALPFTIAARVESAVRRAGFGGTKRALPEAVPLPAPSARDRLRRSRLYLPGSQPKLFVNAALHDPDAVILDLEDSVHPAEKDSARILVRNALRAVDFAGAERMVRINQLPLGFDDLDEVIHEAPDLILIPKVEHAEEVIEVDERITEILSRQGIDRPVWLMPIVESARGIESAFSVATASERTVALTIGLEDYTADLGVVKTASGGESLYARSRVVNAAHAAHLQAIDSVYGDFGDTEGLRHWGTASRAMGFEGMGCIHPVQIPIVHEAFAPSQTEIDKALKIVAAAEEAAQRGLGVVSLGSKMIDPPVVNRAQRLVARARAMGLIGEAAGDEGERS
jgi:citrate lyase subunit beta/citryl-CoA lyase